MIENKSAISIILFLLLTSICFGQSAISKGKVLYESKKYSEAETQLKAIAETSKDYPTAQYYLGRIAFDKKNYDDAVDYFKVATEFSPKEGDYFNWLGVTYAEIGGTSGMLKQMSVGPKAMRAWEKATELDAKNMSARVMLASAYLQAPSFMGGGADKAIVKAKEAFVLLDEALKKTPDNYLYHYWYGKTSALHSLNLDRGEQCLRKYLSHAPKEDEPPLANANLRLAQILEKKGDNGGAKRYYEIALKQDKTLDDAKEGIERTKKNQNKMEID